MNKLEEIYEFIEKNAKVIAELAQAAQYSSLYSWHLSNDIIEQQQDLMRHAKRIGVIAVDKPLFEEAEIRVLVWFNEFCSFVKLEDCKKNLHLDDDKTSYIYSIIIGNIVLQAVETLANEEHKKARVI